MSEPKPGDNILVRIETKIDRLTTMVGAIHRALVYVPPGPTPEEAAEDAAYHLRYDTEGCATAGMPHRFNGDPSDRKKLLYCVDCEMPKKLNAALPGINIEGLA